MCGNLRLPTTYRWLTGLTSEKSTNAGMMWMLRTYMGGLTVEMREARIGNHSTVQ